MNLKKYMIHGLGSLMDGLIAYVDADRYFYDGLADLYCVVRLEQGSKLFPTFSVPLKDESFYIRRDCLSLVEEDEEIEFETSNPYGKFMSEHRYVSSSGVTVTWVMYEEAMTVSVAQEGVTLLNTIFQGTRQEVFDFLCGIDRSYDMDDIVFDLNQKKSDEMWGVKYRRKIEFYGQEEE